MDLPVAIGEIVANKYRIDQFIGAGGMGVVVAAFHLELEQPVAIKFLNGEASSRADAGERFRREARVAARIHSEHVARVLDIELLNNRIPYMVMELLEGRDLERELEQTGPMPTAIAVDYVLQAIDAIAEAHAAGVVHRDLKPTNLFLARRPDGRFLIKVLDFGISKLVGPGWGPDAALTRSASIFGSPLYMSPEQMRSSKDIDARADIWSLGAILYELIAGRPPFIADSMPALCLKVLTDTPTPLSELAPSAPASLQAVLSKCLAREPRDRYESVADLAEALAPFTPNGLAHYERARRMLGQSGIVPSGATARLSSGFASYLPRGHTPAAPDASDPRPANPGPTQSSWGKTDGRAMVNRRIGTAVGAFAIGLLGLLLARALWPSNTVERLQSALPAASPRSPELGASPPVSAATSDASMRLLPPLAPGSSAELGSPAPTTSAVAERPSPSAMPRARDTIHQRANKASMPPSPAPAKGSGDAPALTDFGGRLY